VIKKQTEATVQFSLGFKIKLKSKDSDPGRPKCPPAPPKKFEEISCFSELAILSEWWESFLQKGLRNNTGTGTVHGII
jgi:hypothetical protein